MLSFLKKRTKKSVQPLIEEIASTIKTVVAKPHNEESFIDRNPYKVISEVVAPAKPPEKIYKVPSYIGFPMVSWFTKKSIESPYLIPIGKSRITGFEIYRYTGDDPKIILDICFKFGCDYEEVYHEEVYSK
jgi:hypothetical protein